MKIAFSDLSLPKSGTVVVAATTGSKLTPTAQAVDKATGGAIKRAMAASRFDGKKGQWLAIPGPGGISADRVLVCGIGNAADLSTKGLRDLGAQAVGKVLTDGTKALTFAMDPLKAGRKQGMADGEAAAEVAYGAGLGSYRFDKYRTKQKPEQKPSLTAVTVATGDAGGARRRFRTLDKIREGVFLTRDLVSEPANVLNPVTLAARCKELSKLGVKVEVLNEKRMQRLGMGALLGVGQGSDIESQLVVMQWQGAAKSKTPIAFVGKGVTFDTGGISLKPAGGMEDMKWDMGGAGAVVGLMKALAGRKAKANVIGVVALVENMPSGGAQRPGDVVTSMSGQTIEVINTDAEGRLVLADALWYTQDRFKPQFMINLATLTGAIIVALGHEYAGLFSNDDTLADRLSAVGEAEGEPVWRMPLGDAYDKQINSAIADMKNVGAGRAGGSIAAAVFLQRFVNDTPWAHLDIANMAWSSKAKPTVPKGGTGYGVRLLDRLVSEHYEK